jgi:hypothetical protein
MGSVRNFMSSMKTKFHFLAALAVIALACPATAQVVFDQDFDDTGVFNPSLADGSYAGTDTTTSGRWGEFDTSGGTQYTITTEQAYSGTQSLKLERTAFESGDTITVRRNGASFADPVGTGASSQKQFSVVFQLYMLDDVSNNQGQFLLEWGNTAGTFSTSAGMGVKANGRLMINIGGNWGEMGSLAAVGTNSWTEVRWDYDLDAGSNGQVTGYVGGVAVSATPSNLSFFNTANDRLQFRADTVNGQTSYVDNFQLIPEPSSFALVGLGALALLARRRRHSN